MMSKMRRRKLIITPRWYSYGGLFQSLFMGLSLGKYYKRDVVILYPWVHIQKGCKYPAILNEHLKEFKCDDVNITAGYSSLISRFLSLWISINRWVCSSVLGRLIYKIKATKLFPIFLGFSALNSAGQIQRILGIGKGVDWLEVYKNCATVELTLQQIECARELLKDLPISQGKPYVCLYVRDAGFEQYRTTTGSNICNAPLESFYKAVSFLI